MANIIALVWDFDKTLIPGYMQDPIFQEYGVDKSAFWEENNSEISELRKNGLTVNADSYYLNKFIRESSEGGKFKGLNNAKLEKLGEKIEFCEGVVELFEKIEELNKSDDFDKYGIKVENYVVSTGFKRMIEGSKIRKYLTGVWGAELIDVFYEEGGDEKEKKTRIGEIAYSLDNTTKTRALFEINKGVGIYSDSTIDVNTKIPLDDRRVRFENIIYIADGPSDIPAFSVVRQKNGSTLAVYAPGNEESYSSADKLRLEGRVQMIAEANYNEKTTARFWILKRINERVEQIKSETVQVYKREPGTPKHIV